VTVKLISWNVNGIRAITKKGFFDWFHETGPDILCLQETKAWPEQLEPKLLEPEGYFSYWDTAEKKGYSGVVTYTKVRPQRVRTGLGHGEFDTEGRVVLTEYEDFTLFNVYFPNGKKDNERLKYKLDFYDAFLELIDELRSQGKSIVVCGDFNTAHKAIDLARPKENENISGFLPVEREWMDRLVEHGYADTFRQFNKKPENYTWWDYYTRARSRNVGWRLDYFFVSEDLLPRLEGAFIMSNVMGSDHCPVGIILSKSDNYK
jgi:exodeoxyribonuclease-3